MKKIFLVLLFAFIFIGNGFAVYKNNILWVKNPLAFLGFSCCGEC
jgi:hypothetical protein